MSGWSLKRNIQIWNCINSAFIYSQIWWHLIMKEYREHLLWCVFLSLKLCSPCWAQWEGGYEWRTNTVTGLNERQRIFNLFISETRIRSCTLILHDSLNPCSRRHHRQPESFTNRLKLILRHGLRAIARIISLLDLTEDLKDQIFRYERRFQIFFIRLIEVICFAVKLDYEQFMCKQSVAGCIKSLFLLLTHFGNDMKPVKSTGLI